MKKAIPPMRMYGNIIRYNIPSLMPFAEAWEPSLSSTARHIEHCASAKDGTSNMRSKSIKIFSFILIFVFA